MNLGSQVSKEKKFELKSNLICNFYFDIPQPQFECENRLKYVYCTTTKIFIIGTNIICHVRFFV